MRCQGDDYLVNGCESPATTKAVVREGGESWTIPACARCAAEFEAETIAALIALARR